MINIDADIRNADWPKRKRFREHGDPDRPGPYPHAGGGGKRGRGVNPAKVSRRAPSSHFFMGQPIYGASTGKWPREQEATKQLQSLYAKTLGVPERGPITFRKMSPAENMWGNDPGAYVDMNDTDPLIHVNGTTQRGLRTMSSGSEAGQLAFEVVAHEMIHLLAPMGRNFQRDLPVLKAMSQGDRSLNAVFEEGFADVYAARAIRELTGRTPKLMTYLGGQVMIESLEEKFGAEAVRDIWRQPTVSKRLSAIEELVGQDRMHALRTYAIDEDGNFFTGTARRKAVMKQITEASQTSWMTRIRQAESIEELEQIRRVLEPRHDQLSMGERFHLAEQYGLRYRELTRA